jgi:hypothetical protein
MAGSDKKLRPGARAYDAGHSVMSKPSAVATWAWFLLKNLIGWVLIIGAIPLGALIPGPGGIPLFLIGFGLITFPGKRRLTARVLRGRPISRDSKPFQYAVAILAAVLPAAVFAYLIHLDWIALPITRNIGLLVAAAYVLTAAILWWLGLHSYGIINAFLAWVPRMRRKIRPWLRRIGIDLLPPRRKRRKLVLKDGHLVRETDPEIIEIHQRHMTRLRRGWRAAKPWLRRAAGVVITVAIFSWIVQSMFGHWQAIASRMATIRWSVFFLSAAMFALFLFTCRALVWRQILIGFGYRVPIPPAVRIWSTSELARYLPGVIWQVIGRVYLVKPYGVRGSVCSASQVLELAIFLLANVLVAVGCLAWLGVREMDGHARFWMSVALASVPVLIFLLHPKILFRLINGVLARLHKPPIEPRMGFRTLTGLLLWSVAGLLFQSLAIWLLVEEPLGGLQLAKWWVIAGSYCLAWVAGFLAVWAPAGLGVREVVFIGAMTFALPQAVHVRFDADPDELVAVIMFLAVLLRLWATVGELILAAAAHLLDLRAALPGSPPTSPRLPPDESPAPAAPAPELRAASPSPAPAAPRATT